MTKVGVLWRGDWRAPDAPARHAARLRPVMEALEAEGLEAAALVYIEETAAALRERMRGLAGVLVWVNPLEEGRDRAALDALLREVAAAGTWVSTHPDIIDKMGIKDVLFRTRALGWGAATELYGSLADFDARFSAGAARVLKPRRGNDGRGVMKVAADGPLLKVQHASDDRIERLTQAALSAVMAPVFAASGAVIDQPFVPAGPGMVRCYMAQGRVVGFGVQQPRRPGPDAFGMNSAKTMHPADAAIFADLRLAMEQDWVPGLQRILEIETDRLPALWDADFLWRPEAEWQQRGRFVLCEVNVSCVSPFPPDAPLAVAQVARRVLRAR